MDWGFSQLIPLTQLNDPSNGFLHSNGTFRIKAVIKVIYLSVPISADHANVSVCFTASALGFSCAVSAMLRMLDCACLASKLSKLLSIPSAYVYSDLGWGQEVRDICNSKQQIDLNCLTPATEDEPATPARSSSLPRRSSVNSSPFASHGNHRYSQQDGFREKVESRQQHTSSTKSCKGMKQLKSRHHCER